MGKIIFGINANRSKISNSLMGKRAEERTGIEENYYLGICVNMIVLNTH